jgi:hypothetical protein
MQEFMGTLGKPGLLLQQRSDTVGTCLLDRALHVLGVVGGAQPGHTRG